MCADPYASIAEYYDVEHASYGEDFDFYLNFIVATGDPVLELACGSGRLLVPIAEAGYRVTGLDRSPAMLARAAKSVAEAGVSERVRLHEGDMTEAPAAPGGPFGVVIIALNGLLHAEDLSTQRRVLEAARAALDPRGQLLIDVLNPTPDTLKALDHTLVHEGTWQLANGDRLDKFSARRVHPARQIIQTEVWYDRTSPDGSVRRTATSFPMRYLHPGELELLLELAGFAEWQIYGSYDLDPLDDHSDRILVAAEVTPSPRPR
ncbi:MAG TPA: class I SAM-dependent methyltransferase [Thermomicrobiales bacterium]